MAKTLPRAALCVVLGFTLFFVGFRLTSEVIPVLLATMLGAAGSGLPAGRAPASEPAQRPGLAFPFVAAMIGWAIRRLAEQTRRRR